MANRSASGGTAAIAAAMFALAGCAQVPLPEDNGLSSSAKLGKATGTFGKTRSFADKPVLDRSKTVRIKPATVSAKALSNVRKPAEAALVANAIDRSVCIALSDRYTIVGYDQPADLTVHSVITDIVPTDEVVAGASVAASLGSRFVLPVGVPRLPLGLGGMSVSGEAVDPEGDQVAALVWAKGANMITTRARVSRVGDAYALVGSYAGDFGDLVSTGKQPAAIRLKVPTPQQIQSYLGGSPKYAVCDQFGRQPGLPGLVSGVVGAPPDWTDRSAQPTAKAAPAAKPAAN